ncbi:GNAT family N-acetyltransferase [uncultured Tateyamaria sp.]|uniref:GNAT family N-acetyltransferase n=1 Tax=uncultured Tateyamaria sp. TaxID=455651 RepID=UPI002635AFA9|nr:GNAT family N-acetyltransferase [uncultured Tateyamaria sp.]
MTFTIRPVDPADIPALHMMICALAAHHGDTPNINPTHLRRDVLGTCPWYTVLVAEQDAALIGYAALLPLGQLQFGARGMDMHHLFVRDHRRGQGVGAALVSASQAHCRKVGCTVLTVGTHPDNAKAARFYERRGFEPRSGPGPRFSIRLDQPPT